MPLPCSSLIPQFLQNPLSTGPQVGAVSGSFDQTWGALSVLLARRKRVSGLECGEGPYYGLGWSSQERHPLCSVQTSALRRGPPPPGLEDGELPRF